MSYVFHDNQEPIEAIAPSGWEIVDVGHQRALINNQLNKRLRTDAIGVDLGGSWHIEDDLRLLKQSALGRYGPDKEIRDEYKVRLASDLMIDGQMAERVILQETTYFDSLATNELAMTTAVNTKGGKTFHGESLLLTPEGMVYPLSNSPCSNHIGISTFAITSDNMLVLAQQGLRSAQYRGRWTASGSGSIDWADVGRQSTLQELLINAMERELSEECGIARSLCNIETVIVGFGRILERGGKPEFVGISRLDIPWSNLAIPEREKKFVASLHPWVFDIESGDAIERLAAMRRTLGTRISPSLALVLTALEDQLG